MKKNELQVSSSSVLIQNAKLLKARIRLPKIENIANNSFSGIKSNWKFVGNSSSFMKQDSINGALKNRKQNVVLNLKRKLKNPYCYISNNSSLEVDIQKLNDRYTKLITNLKHKEY